MRRETLMRLYPAAWRERYEEEFLQLIDDRPLGLQETIDIVSGAIDARLRGGVQRASSGGDQMIRVLKAGCRSNAMRMTTRDGLIGAAVLLTASLVLSLAGGLLRREGYIDGAEVLLGMSFPIALAISMPWTFMKGQPWRAQAFIVGALLVMMGLITLAKLTF